MPAYPANFNFGDRRHNLEIWAFVDMGCGQPEFAVPTYAASKDASQGLQLFDLISRLWRLSPKLVPETEFLLAGGPGSG
jgi:hypothetical protein